ncbi:NAD-dependent succinate-semialdehyde dehydrogenase [Nesterenkonia sp. E16_7]|uniref:NAD-dependent succinate-semialdehyde dehydrogenase n=1 Tax=unclassified Nesterenkonia TaxID=2629769 RepID=UPI001A91CF28|nr:MULTISPECIES: NAD-dependent succinate-semialdehyde dehydrogenase [unclassified Nesterenkonia]MBO0594523.1 NAD-dependent succinate-semialdehyde dehydrogenase [Nesterenkonia sp. E16_10]MBO0597269.1 NAD-dependent succinate-semialdehyde dehydrogenase [Nesterenkonia sp. E16_7]
MDVSPQRLDALLTETPTGLFLDGQWRQASSGARFAVKNPATEETLASVASAGAADARAAMDAAASAQDSWGRTPSRRRAEILRRGFDLVQDHAEQLALLMTLEMGKPLVQSQGEVVYGGEFLRWFSEEAVRDHGRYSDTPEGTLRMLVTRKPVGPCLLITPWNFPLAMATRKVAPALAAGCTMILKPAALTPLTMLYLTALLVEAGLPAGVLNVLPTDTPAAVSEPLLADPRLRKISFTGSTAVGKHLMRQATENVLRTSMELGGNGPLIVFEDADLDKAVAGALAAKMRNMGEACTAANRILVHESVAEEFTAKLAQRMSALKVGSGLEEGVDVGPLIDAKACASVAELVEDAVHRGAEVVLGGGVVEGPGHFFAPTLLRNVSPDSRVVKEEIFGPVAPVLTFGSEDEAVAMANATEYGLASYVFTENISRGLRIGDRIDFGLLGLNVGVISNAAAPFGGVKQSGLGREGGAEGLAEYTSTQYIGIESPWSG